MKRPVRRRVVSAASQPHASLVLLARVVAGPMGTECFLCCAIRLTSFAERFSSKRSIETGAILNFG